MYTKATRDITLTSALLTLGCEKHVTEDQRTNLFKYLFPFLIKEKAVINLIGNELGIHFCSYDYSHCCNPGGAGLFTIQSFQEAVHAYPEIDG